MKSPLYTATYTTRKHEPYLVDAWLKRNRNGWNTIETSPSITSFTTQEIIYDHYVENEQEYLARIKENLVYKLTSQLMESGLVDFVQHKDALTGSTVVRAEVDVVPVGQRFANRTENSFVVDEQTFTNDELVEAVKKAYPEKFI